jgi:hypothetical protein
VYLGSHERIRPAEDEAQSKLKAMHLLGNDVHHIGILKQLNHCLDSIHSGVSMARPATTSIICSWAEQGEIWKVGLHVGVVLIVKMIANIVVAVVIVSLFVIFIPTR